MLCRAATHTLELFPEVSPVSGSDSYVELLQGNEAPVDGSSKHQAAAEKLELHNPQLNREQREAVARAVAPPPEPLDPLTPQRPFILFGPAGTGKTLTLTEVVLQVMLGRTLRHHCSAIRPHQSLELLTYHIDLLRLTMGSNPSPSAPPLPPMPAVR